MSAEPVAGPATAEEDILARAYEEIASCDELTEMITLIISKARSMRVDREAIEGLVTAARKLSDGDNWVAEALKGTGRDRFPTDVEMFDAIREVDDHLSAYDRDMTDLVDRAYAARKRARNALRLAQLQLLVAMAKPVKLKCDGCHDARRAAIDEAQRKIDDARNREALADEAITILEEACSDVTAALVAIRGVPDDYEGCYAEALRLIREDPEALPKDTDFLTGYGSRLVHRPVSGGAARAITEALSRQAGAGRAG